MKRSKHLETRHFDSSNYISNRRSPSAKSHERKKKLCNQNFAGSPISHDVTASPIMEEFAHYSKDKITCKTLAFL